MLFTNHVLDLFPLELAGALRNCHPDTQDTVEEIRCRVDSPPLLLTQDGEYAVSCRAVRAGDLEYLLERASGASVHTVADELRQGFLHTMNGCRIGLCGSAYSKDGQVAGVRQISSVAVRIPHEAKGCADPILNALLEDGFQSTLLVAPPGFGKTTLLREIIRQLSEYGLRIALADERGEVAAVYDRVPQFDLGPRTDVMTGGSKAACCMMLLRAMNPQVLAFDEITTPEDIAAMEVAAGCGVQILATAHALGPETLRQRALYRRLLDDGIFRRAVRIQRQNGARHYEVEAL